MPETFRYTSNTTLRDIAARIRQAEHVLITTHAKPDGDAIGSTLALRTALLKLGKAPEAVIAGPIETTLERVMGDAPVIADSTPSRSEFDLVLVVDTGSWNQLDPMRWWLEPMRDRIIVIDHHVRGDDLADHRFIDTAAASTTTILIDLLDELGVDLTDGSIGSVAESLFVGLATDTGWFRHSNADGRAFACAARLLRAGVNKNRLYQLLEESHRPARLALEGRALASLEYAREGTAAIMSIEPDDFREIGVSSEDLTGIVNLPMVVSDVCISVLLSQDEPKRTKLSFRSKPAIVDEASEDVVDVNRLAQQFGGGGHKHAAGARVQVDLHEARSMVLEALRSV